VQAPDELGGGVVRWGSQLDVQQLAEDVNERRRRASYLAKYSTKSTEQAGGLLHRVHPSEVDAAPVREHVRRYLRTAFELHDRVRAAIGADGHQAPKRDGRDRRLAACAHAFGYRGHCLTKSRRWSTTFTALRQAREDHVREQLLAKGGPKQRELAQLAGAERITAFEFVGVGHLTTADAWLAAQAAARARENRELAREALYDDRQRRIEHGWGATRQDPVDLEGPQP
jgi:hypothetical protein